MKAKRSSSSQSTSLVEWALGAAGAIMVLAAIIYLVYFGTVASSAPPSLHVAVRDISPLGDSFLVSIEVTNKSAQTAAQVQVVGILRIGSGQENSEANFDYVPAFSIRRGGLLFRNDPATGTLQISPQSYSLP